MSQHKDWRLSFDLDILGQQPLAKVYSPLTFCFPSTGDSYDVGLSVLQNGLSKLSVAFPWIAGQVVNEGVGPGTSGIFRIAALDPTPRLTVKDLRHDSSLDFSVLQEAGFPARLLDEEILAPCKTLPQSASDILPVLLLQASLVRGGLLLTIAGQHNAMDMIAQGQVVHLLSKACYGQDFTQTEINVGNLDRRNTIPLLEHYEQGPELALQVGEPLDPASNQIIVQPSRPRPGGYTWTRFEFDISSLARLKAFAMESQTSDYISTDDALTALIWQSVLRCRSKRLQPTRTANLCRAIDVRSFLDLPKTYMGFMQNGVYYTSTLQKWIEQPLGHVASQLRSSIDPPSAVVFNTRAYATMLARTADKSRFSFLKNLDFTADLMITSWVKLNSYNLDFNFGLGKPEVVLRPTFPPVEGLVFLMPKSLEGGISISICLRNDDMEKLKVDDMFVKYAVCIG